MTNFAPVGSVQAFEEPLLRAIGVYATIPALQSKIFPSRRVSNRIQKLRVKVVCRGSLISLIALMLFTSLISLIASIF
jgi:hypothetical protein